MRRLPENQQVTTRGHESRWWKGVHITHTLPKIDELYAKLKGYKVFSSLDLRLGYYHTGLTDTAKPKSAFMLSSLGKYQFNRVPFDSHKHQHTFRNQ